MDVREHFRILVKYYNAKKKTNDSRNYTNSKNILWVPTIGPKIRKEFKMVNKDITFTSGKNLQSILYQNKPNRPSWSVPVGLFMQW